MIVLVLSSVDAEQVRDALAPGPLKDRLATEVDGARRFVTDLPPPALVVAWPTRGLTEVIYDEAWADACWAAISGALRAAPVDMAPRAGRRRAGAGAV